MVITFLYTLYMSLVNRIHGGGLVPSSSKGINNALFAIGVMAPGIIAYLSAGNDVLQLSSLAIPLAFGAVVALKGTGHGQYFDLATWPTPVSDEKLDFIVKLFYGDDTYTSYSRDAFGLLVTGLFAVLPAAIFLGVYGGVIPAILLAVAGACKPLGYMIGWAYNPTGVEQDKPEPNVVGEYFHGALLGLTIGAILNVGY